MSALSKQLAALGIRPGTAPPPLSHVEEIAALVEDLLAQPPSAARASDFAELHAVMTLWLPVVAGGVTHSGAHGGCDHAQVRIDPTCTHLLCKACAAAVSPVWWLARFHGALAEERAAAQAELERIRKAIAALQGAKPAPKRTSKKRGGASGTRTSQLTVDARDPNLQGEVKR